LKHKEQVTKTQWREGGGKGEKEVSCLDDVGPHMTIIKPEGQVDPNWKEAKKRLTGGLVGVVTPI